MNQRYFGWIPALAIVSLVLASIVRSDFVMAGASVMLFFLVPIIARPVLFWMATIVTLGCGIFLGLSADLSLNLTVMLGFVVFIIAKLAVSGRSAIQSIVPRKACVALLVVVVITAFIRGWGLKVLGSDTWGGMQYVNMIGALLFYIYSAHVTISQKQLERTLRWLFLLSLIPVAGYLLLHFMPSMKWVENMLAVDQAEETWQATEGIRLGAMQSPAMWMGIFALFKYEHRSKFTPAVVLVSALSFIMVGLSGHRGVVVLLGLTIFVYLMIKRREVRVIQFVNLVGVLTVVVVILYFFVGNLPHTFQRAVAWLPGIDVAHEAEMDASSTSVWRLELWRQLLPMVPDYLWIGRGLAFNQNDAQLASVLASDAGTQHIFLTAVHLYHNGPLWLILDLGLAGFLFGLVFMMSGIVYYGKQLRRIQTGSKWSRAYVVFYSFFVGECIFYLSVFGAGKTFFGIIILASILEVIVRSVEAEARSDGVPEK